MLALHVGLRALSLSLWLGLSNCQTQVIKDNSNCDTTGYSFNITGCSAEKYYNFTKGLEAYVLQKCILFTKCA